MAQPGARDRCENVVMCVIPSDRRESRDLACDTRGQTGYDDLRVDPSCAHLPWAPGLRLARDDNSLT
jgi:hypothetical protein